MKAEFFKDTNGKIWFYYARDINIRNCVSERENNAEDAKEKAKKIEKNKQAVR